MKFSVLTWFLQHCLVEWSGDVESQQVVADVRRREIKETDQQTEDLLSDCVVFC